MPELKKMHDAHQMHEGHGHHQEKEHHDDHHGHMVEDFRKRFWICLILTLPILVLSPTVQKLLGLDQALRFPGDTYVLFVLSSAVFFYGGYPFLKGLVDE